MELHIYLYKKKYGSTSLYFNGSSSLKIPSSSNTAFLSKDFTIKWQEYVLSNISFQPVFISEIKPLGYMGMIVGYGTINRLHYMSTNITDWTINAVSMGAFNINTQNHFALCRSGSYSRTFKNGTLVTTTIKSGITYQNETNWSIGGYIQGRPTNILFNGYIENFTVTIGFPKYSASFTPTEIVS